MKKILDSNLLLMEAIVYTSLLIGTLGIIFFAIFFREPPRIVKLTFVKLKIDRK